MRPATALNPNEAYETTGGRLVSTDGRVLPLTGATLSADARGGMIRITLEQTFRNPHHEPLHVTYSLPLPADGAVSGFSFKLGDEHIIGEVDTKQQARARFENAILEGRTAAILDQERSSVFTQEVGNVPPRSEVVCQVQVDQKLAWLPDGCWEWRFPTVVAPRYLGAVGRVAEAAKVTVDVADEAMPVKLGLSLSIRDHLAETVRPESPSHALHSARALGRTDVTFADERGMGLDRDVVVRWRVAQQTPGTSLDLYEKDGRLFGLLTITPPAAEASMKPVARDLIVLLDTSGSMSGSPIDQARRMTSALVDSLRDEDQLELIEFSMTARRWKRGPVSATASNRRDAQAWLSRLQASGGTEMRTGILEALAPLRPDAQRQIVLITDGLIGFESEIVQTVAHHLPKGSRVHTIGVGSGVNRTLTQPTARAGRGLELIMGIGEDVEVAVQRLLARTNQPLVTNVEVSGAAVKTVAPARVADLYAQAPALISLELDPRGGPVTISGDVAGGRLEETVYVSSTPRSGSPAVATLFAREQVEDLELSLAAGATKSEIDNQIKQLGLRFQISTRLTSWVAVSARQTVDPRAPRRSETMPQNLPFGMSAEGVGLRSAASPAPRGGAELRRRGLATVGRAMSKASSVERESSRSEEASMMTGMRALEEAPEPEPAANTLADSADDESGDDGSPEVSAPPPPAAPATPARKQVAEPAEKKKGMFGLFELAKDMLSPKAPAAAKPAARSAPGMLRPTEAKRTLRGQLIRVTDRETTFEVAVDDAALAWAPSATASVQLADGTMVQATVVLDKTTVEGTHGVGLQLTLVLAGDFTNAQVVRIVSGAAELEIVVR